MSRFPKLTETFILFELLALEEQGVDIEVYPLLRERQTVMHPEAAPVVERAHYLPFVSPAILGSNVVTLLRRPRAYLGALARLARESVGSRNYLLGGLAIFPKVVHMARDMERRGVRHVHCHFSNHPAAAGFVIHRLTGIPYSFTAHGSDLHIDRHMLCAKLRESAFAVAISDENRRVMHAECGAPADERVQVIHCGVDTEVFAPPPVVATAARPFTVVAVGTLHEVKGQVHLVEACRRLAAAGLDFRCRIVGTGPDEERLRGLIAHHALADRVTLEGARTRQEIAALLREGDVLAAPSVPTRDGRREGIPVVLMEAMATGLPVVTSRLSGIPELVEDGVTGFLTEPGDAAGIASALERLHGDPELRGRLGASARARVVESYDVRRNAMRLLAAMTSLGGLSASERSPRVGAKAGEDRRRGFTVALIGPDGAGKTSIARRLLDELPRSSYLYMGVNPGSGNRLLPTTRLVHMARRRTGRLSDPHANPHEPHDLTAGRRNGLRDVRGGVRAMLRLANRLTEEWYRQGIAWWRVRRGDVVVFDRHYYFDYHATDIAPRRTTVARRLHGLVLQHLLPKPDLILYLDAPAHVLFARKGEGTLESLERKRQEYLELIRSFPHHAVVDVTRPEREVVDDVRARVEAYGAST